MCRPMGFAIASAVMLLASCGGGGGSSGPTGPSGAPIVTLVNGATLPSAPIGATVVIQGSNFGSGQAAASGQVLFANGSGGPDTALIASAGDWSNTLIVTTVPAGGAPRDPAGEKSRGPSTPAVLSVPAQEA